MKKIYKKPAFEIISSDLDALMFRQSFEEGEEGSEKYPVESKESSFTDFDNSSDFNWDED